MAKKIKQGTTKPLSLLARVNLFTYILIAIFLLGLFVRVYRFDARWGFGSDDTRDISIAKEALARGELPLIGSFSSAGPFVFGPLFYWIIMVSYIVLPFTLVAPWIITVFFGLATVVIAAYIGYLLDGKKLAILLSLLTATSPQFAYRSTTLTQHTYVGFATFCLLLFFILFWQKKKLLYAFLMGVALGAGVSFHYQALNLLIFFPTIFFVPHISFNEKIKGLSIMILGFIIPSLPILIWDSRQNFANFNNILDYFLLGQYRIYIPNSWRLFLFTYLPRFWSVVVGGEASISLFLIAITFIASFLLVMKKNMFHLLLTLGIMFCILLIANKFYRGERFEGYIIYLAPLILLFSAYAIEQLLWAHAFVVGKTPLIVLRVIGLIILLTVLFGNFHLLFRLINDADNKKDEIQQTTSALITHYHGKKLALYDRKWKSSDILYPLAALLKEKDKTDRNGIPIGINFLEHGEVDTNSYPIVATISGRPILDLTNIKDLRKNGWVRVTQEDIYDDLITQWTKKEKLHSSFSLTDFVISRFKK